MYRFGRERDSFQLLAQRLQPDVALGMLWLAGRFEMPELQRAVAARLDSMDAGENCWRIAQKRPLLSQLRSVACKM